MIKNSVICAAVLFFSCGPLYGTDIARDVVAGEAEDNSFVELGLTFLNWKVPLVGFNTTETAQTGGSVNTIDIGVQARLEFRGFFAEVINDSFSNITLGYVAIENDTSSLEVIATSIFGEIDRSENEGFESIDDRKGDINLGFRGNYMLGDNQVQVELVGDAGDAHNGILASAQIGRVFQVRNWNIHALGGVRYFSDKVLDHYFSVSAEESTAEISAYKAEHGFLPTVQIGATVPINEDWIFRASAEYSRLPDTVANSPLAQGDDMYVLQTGVYRILYP